MVCATIRASDTGFTVPIGAVAAQVRRGWDPLRRDLVGDADHAGAGVRADDGADVTDDSPLAGEEGIEQLEELVEVGGVAVHDGQVLDGPFLADLVGEVAQGARPRALA